LLLLKRPEFGFVPESVSPSGIKLHDYLLCKYRTVSQFPKRLLTLRVGVGDGLTFGQHRFGKGFPNCIAKPQRTWKLAPDYTTSPQKKIPK
jgi:hypothetical protein